MDKNENDIPYINVNFKDIKYNRSVDGKDYALYKIDEEACVCAYTHLYTRIDKYTSLLGRETHLYLLFLAWRRASPTYSTGRKWYKNPSW